MPSSRVNGFTVALPAVGMLLVWSGVKGTNPATTFKDLLNGQQNTTSAYPISPGERLASQSDSGGGDSGSSGGSAAPGDTGAHSASARANQAIAKVLAAPYGWSTGTEWQDLVSLWNRESQWSNIAQNPTSTAYGIAQFLDTTWASVGGTRTSDPTAQIRYGLKYIKQRYGDPEKAWAHEISAGWY